MIKTFIGPRGNDLTDQRLKAAKESGKRVLFVTSAPGRLAGALDGIHPVYVMGLVDALERREPDAPRTLSGYPRHDRLVIDTAHLLSLDDLLLLLAGESDVEIVAHPIICVPPPSSRKNCEAKVQALIADPGTDEETRRFLAVMLDLMPGSYSYERTADCLCTSGSYGHDNQACPHFVRAHPGQGFDPPAVQTFYETMADLGRGASVRLAEITDRLRDANGAPADVPAGDLAKPQTLRPSPPGENCTCTSREFADEGRHVEHATSCPLRTEADNEWCRAQPAPLPVTASEGAVRRAAAYLVSGVLARMADGSMDNDHLRLGAWRALRVLSPAAYDQAGAAQDQHKAQMGYVRPQRGGLGTVDVQPIQPATSGCDTLRRDILALGGLIAMGFESPGGSMRRKWAEGIVNRVGGVETGSDARRRFEAAVNALGQDRPCEETRDNRPPATRLPTWWRP